MVTSQMFPLTQRTSFGFAVRSALIMHASQRSPMGGVRDAVLRIVGLKPVGRKLINAERASEKASIVARRLQLNKPSVTERCRVKLHGTTPRYLSDDAVRFATYCFGCSVVWRRTESSVTS